MQRLTDDELLTLLSTYVLSIEHTEDVDINLCVNTIKALNYSDEAVKCAYQFKDLLKDAKDRQAGEKIYGKLVNLWIRASGQYGAYEPF